MKKFQSYIVSVIFGLLLFLGGITLFFMPHKEYSEAERRPLAEAPDVSVKTVWDGSFFSNADKWVTDHFQFREAFRHIKAEWQIHILGEENNDFVYVDGSVIKLERTVNEYSLDYAAERFGNVYDSFLKDTNCKIYCALIPDKSFFLRDGGYPVMDFEKMEVIYQDMLPGATPISIKDELQLNDYYNTDSHWKQECIVTAANKLISAMQDDFKPLKTSDFINYTYEPFDGVYSGQSALYPAPDVITYLSNDILAGCRVIDFGAMKEIPMYDSENCDSRDPYTLFLGGSKGYLQIENPNVSTGKDLVVFRDSFGSSIAPLLVTQYSTVTLIDIRYIHPTIIRQYMQFDHQDVLFLYSAILMNNSQGLN